MHMDFQQDFLNKCQATICWQLNYTKTPLEMQIKFGNKKLKLITVQGNGFFK